MAKRSLEHEARTRQSHSKILETLVCKLSDSDDLGLDFQDNTFSLTFSSTQWYLLLRLLHAGSTLADQVLVPKPELTPLARTKAAQLWNILSNELSDLLDNDEVKYERKGAPKETR